jgi:hypothetical protein
MAGYGYIWPKSFCERTVQTAVGRAIAGQFDLAEPLPDKLSELLQRLDQPRGEAPQAPH